METLTIDGCPVTEEENYREEIFKLIPQLKCVDGKDHEDNDVVVEDENSSKEEQESEEESKSVNEASEKSEEQDDSSVKIVGDRNELIKEDSKAYDYSDHGLASSVFKGSFSFPNGTYQTLSLEDSFNRLADLEYQFNMGDLANLCGSKQDQVLRDDLFEERLDDDQGSDSDSGKLVDSNFRRRTTQEVEETGFRLI